MRAYVIKNKEGKYKTESVGVEIQSYFLRDIRCSEIFTDKEVGKCFCPSDCEVVEITIVEGDLEKENAVLRKALELACEDLQFFDYGIETKEQGIEMKKNYFIEQAKESLDVEN